MRSLVEQLDSEDLAQRDRARQDLTELGRKILPLLKPFLKSPSAEVAGQVRGIVERFEWDERLERTLPALRTVTLTKGPHTPAEILAEIRRQTGYRIDVYGLKTREPVDVGWEKVPVLRALDELCRLMGQGRPEPPSINERTTDDFNLGDRSPEPSSPKILIQGESKLPCAIAHWNQFRAAVNDLVITENRSLKNSSSQATVNLTLSAQPGTRPIHVGAWEVEEILDDRGASLVLGEKGRGDFDSESAPDAGESLDSVWFEVDSDSHYRGSGPNPLALKPPAPEARKIARMKLKVKLTFAVEELTRTLKIKEIQEKGTGTADFGLAQITFSQPKQSENSFHLHYLVSGPSHGVPAPVLLDKDGAEIRTRGGGSRTSGADHDRDWYLRGSPEVAAVRVSAWKGRKTIEIPLAFSDIPLPGDR
ncbi:MAG TPA: hypothetical protein VEN81_14060 [Planctomycetota bacterium]|nr:hypothetical protein [Planctomycetota bacterium]